MRAAAAARNTPSLPVSGLAAKIVTYCQTHHRAAHTYFVLRLLGYPGLVGYDRSWSEWGNRDDLPLAR